MQKEGRRTWVSSEFGLAASQRCISFKNIFLYYISTRHRGLVLGLPKDTDVHEYCRIKLSRIL